MKINVIITAGGISQRYGDKNKLFEKCGTSFVVIEAIKPFLEIENVTKIIIGIESSFADELDRELDFAGIKYDRRITLCIGGKTRTQTVKNALVALDGDADIVLVHDGARPYVKKAMIDEVIKSTCEHGVALPLLPLTDAIVDVNNNATPTDRARFMRVQTPFGAKRDIFEKAYKGVEGAFYDDLSVIKGVFDGKIGIIDGDYDNIKITYAGDIKSKNNCAYLTGCGYDIHRMTDGDGIKLLGIKIPCPFSFIAHSDGDVPIHAVMDAILSALGEKDIGHLFPVDDKRYDGADSMGLLCKVLTVAREHGYKVHNMTVSIIAERPMLSPYIDKMRKNMSDLLGISIERVGVSATTNEKVGEIGHENAIAAYASVLLTQI